ncbi:MAG: SGNH/GDSL hydrolase family protein [Elusimicrobiota bacterium]
MKKALKVTLVWTLLFLILGEAGLRLFAWADRRWLLSPRAQAALANVFQSPEVVRQMRRRSPSLLYKNAPGYRTGRISINDLGFRGRPISVEKTPGVRRIVCLGDSCTFGATADADTYPALLEKNLNAAGAGPVEVINAGVPGYSSWQGLVFWREDVARLKPDVLVLYLGWNDIFEARPETGEPLDPGEKRRAHFLRRSLLATQVRAALVALRRRGEGRRAAEADLYRGFEPRYFLRQMETLIREARGSGARVVLLTLPAAYAPGRTALLPSDYAASNPEKFRRLYDAYDAAIRRLAAEHGAELADAAALMNGRRELFADFCHPSEAGNAVIAGELARRLAGPPRS